MLDGTRSPPADREMREQPLEAPEWVDFSPVRGGPFFRIQRSVHLVPRGGLGLVRRAVLLSLVAWAPLAIWAYLHARLVSGIDEPLLRHFGIPVRALVAIPLFVLAEGGFEKAIARDLRYLVTSGLLPRSKLPALRTILEQATRMRDSWPVFVLGTAAVAALVLYGAADFARVDVLNWAVMREGGEPHLGFGGFWFLCVLMPLFWILALHWLWRVLIVTRAFWGISRLGLVLAPTHPDGAAGLGFLERFPAAFSPVAFALGAVAASTFGHEILHHGAHVKDLAPAMAVLAALTVGLFLTPLLAFAPLLLATKRDALRAYGALVARHGRLVDAKWIRGESVSDADVLDAPELGPVADIQTLYETIQKIRPAPIGRSSVIGITLATLLPLLPVVATEVPLAEVLKRLLGALM